MRLEGLDAGAMLLDAPAAWPALTISSEVADVPVAGERVTEGEALLRLKTGGRLALDRSRRTAHYAVPRPLGPDELVHPYLAPAAAMINRWHGRESIHAGAFAVDGRALGVVGTREAGKSSTLAYLALNGTDVLCDDMLIVDGDHPLAGPRSIDLRADAAQRFEAGEAIGMTGARERWRLKLGPTAPNPTLIGWVFLAWGDKVEARKLPARERIPRIASERGLRLPPVRPDSLLTLAELPAWELSRPQGWESLPQAADLLLALASATPTAGG
jgi:hypothetical protein